MIVVYILIAVFVIPMAIFDLKSFILFILFGGAALLAGGLFQGQCNAIRNWRNK